MRPGKQEKPLVQSTLQRLAVSPYLLKRGFWLYVWKIATKEGRTFHYVGRTGDSSSINAQSPMGRIIGHLGVNPNTNQIRRHMLTHGIGLEDCLTLEFVTYGPILEETKERDLHLARRNVVAALEKKLCDSMKDARYLVLNRIACRHPLDAALWVEVREAFAADFSDLTS